MKKRGPHSSLCGRHGGGRSRSSGGRRRRTTTAQQTLLARPVVLLLPLLLVSLLSFRNATTTATTTVTPAAVPPPLSSSALLLAARRHRGGGGNDDGAEKADQDDDQYDENDQDQDEERYSRQVYTLGARAHNLVRSSTVYLDGPPGSGLLYETAKNLALSGVRRIVILLVDDSDGDNEQSDSNYHNAALDDLGNAYRRAARAELGITGDDDDDDDPTNDHQLLKEYVQRLNPSVAVSTMSRKDLFATAAEAAANPDDGATGDGGRRVLVAIDRPYSTQVALNRLAREHNGRRGTTTAFVSIETAGVFGRAFCDFGPAFEVHDADGETPLVTPLDRVEAVQQQQEANDDDTDNSKVVTVHCVEGERHDVSKGDTVRFQWRDGTLSEETWVVAEVQTPFRFQIKMMMDDEDDDAKNSQRQQSDGDIEELLNKINQHAASFRRIKVPQTLSFERLDVAAERARRDDTSLFTPCDLDKSFDGVRRTAAFSCFQALSAFVEREGRLPTTDTGNKADADEFWKLARESRVPGADAGDAKNSNNNDDEKERRRHCQNFLRGCAAKLSPLQCLFGAIGAQEALKAATGLYYPTHQFLLYDCDEILGTAAETKAKSRTTTNVSSEKADPLSAPGLRYILGDSTVDKLQSQKVFVVGAGAIGCEILKNLASMGVGTRKKGKICLTDMDTIEKSNLSRQLLFRDSDVGKFKSTAAHAAALRFHPGLKVESHSSKVGGSEHTPFDDKFWSKNVNVVMNALDNVEARLYMDSQCVANQKALVDAGTMGPKGNVQVVVPRQSESYASSADPPEQAIPVCTLKNFPYAISHTIQWGRELFDSFFERRPNQANDFINSLRSSSVDELASRLVGEKGDDAALEAARELSEDIASLAGKEPKNWESCREVSLAWASSLAATLFFKAAEDLLSQHPLDSLDEDGEPFWTGTRRPPRALSFVDSPTSSDSDQATINENVVEFVKAAARLRSEALVETGEEKSACFTTDEVVTFLKSSIGANTCLNDLADDSNRPVAERVRALLENVSPGSRSLGTTEFEKDDESNGHVEFISAASNLRAIAYGIPPVDAMETRRVAGNIVPAMITTTAFVSALSCVELIKLTQKAPLRLHRNAFVNLALPFFAFTVPLPAEQIPGLKDKTYTLWDRMTVKEGQKAAASGGLTMRSLLRRIKKQIADDIDPESIDVASVSLGPYMLFANFLHDEDESVLGSSIWKLVDEAVSSDGLDEDAASSREGDASASPVEVDCSSYLDLQVIVEDHETGEEVELPVVRVQRHAA